MITNKAKARWTAHDEKMRAEGYAQAVDEIVTRLRSHSFLSCGIMKSFVDAAEFVHAKFGKGAG